MRIITTARPLRRPALRLLVAVFVAAVLLAVLVPRTIEDPERALQRAVAGVIASRADDPLLAAALDQYPDSAPAIVVTYGQLELFRQQLARFGPQVVPIVAAYQGALTTADALQYAGEAWRSVGRRLGGEVRALAPLTPEARGLLALTKMQDEGNAFVGQWEITAAGVARRVPSRMVTLGGPELLVGGLTAVERDLVQQKEIDWRTYGLAAVDVAAIASGAALLRFARTAARGLRTARAAEGVTTFRSSAMAAAEVVGIRAVRFGVPVGLVALMALHPGVFTNYAWVLAESLGVPGILGPIVLWSVVIVPLSLLLSWLLLSVRVLRLSGWLLAGAARGCRRLALHLAPADGR